MPDKTAIIIDHVRNCYLHGLPDDNREWTLEPKAKQANMVKIRECPMCFSVYPPTKQMCPYCGYAAVKEIQRKDKEVVEIDLVEMKRQEDIKNTKLADADLKTWPEIVEFQKLHKYKFAWCIMAARERQAVLSDIARSGEDQDRIRAIDTLNKMTGEYVTKIEGNISAEINNPFKDLTTEELRKLAED